MGARGPAGKPIELKALEGNRGHRPLDLTAHFRPEVGLPTAPAWLSREGRKAWKRLTPELVRYNLIATVDRDALAMLCQTIGRLEIVERSIAGAQKLLEAEGKDAALSLVGLTPKGMQVQSVMYQVLNRETDKLRTLLAEFGLTPAQRARVTTAVRVQLKLFEGGAVDGQPPAKPAEPAAPAGFADFE
jgi:P27 family predicted phage terminase small subunit